MALSILFGLCSIPLAEGQDSFRRIPTQWIAALGDKDVSSGNGSQNWGLWRKDPGPRGVRLEGFNALESNSGIARAGWKFDTDDWWLEEHGLIMEKPAFPLAPGKYVVTGGRKVTSILTIYPPDKDGDQRWELSKGAKLYDVTHLPCRSARYTPADDDLSCTPARARPEDFPVSPGAVMPDVEGCAKQDYAVLFVIGVGVR